MKKKTIVFSMAMVALLLLPQTLTAQNDEDKYGIQPWFGSSLLGREGSRSSNGGDALSLQNFSEDVNDLSLQTFGEGVPTGSGMFILIASGISYAASKKRKKQTSETIGKENKK